MGKTTIEAIVKNNQICSFIRSGLLLLFIVLINFNIQAQFTCDPAFYQIIDNDLLILNTATGNYDTVGTAADAPEPINAAGYNRLDNHIYGLGVSTGAGGGSGQLFRIEDDGSFIQLTNPPFNESSVSGDVDDTNHLWIRSSGNQGRNMKRISLDGTGPTPYAVTDENFPNGASILPGAVGGIADIVYIASTELGAGATSDYIFAVSEDAILIIWEVSTQTVFTKTINGFAYGATSAATGNITPGSSGLFGAGWTDRNGNLFFSNNGTSPAMGGAQAAVWQITDFLPANSGTATATWIIDSETVTANDGAGCPIANAPIPSILDCTQPTAITGLSNVVINEGDNTSFTVTGGSPGTLSWEITPTTGVSQATGTGVATGAITFANSGSFTITFTSSNATDPTGCNSTETSEATAMITVNASTPIDDGDGVDAAVENAGPNGGDGNNDGIPDAQQGHVASILDAVGDKYITLEVVVTGDCAQITNMSPLLETDLPIIDQDFDYPRGLVDFTLQCGAAGQSADVSIYWHNISDISNFRKYGSSAPGAADASYDNFVANTTTELIDGRIVPVTSYTLTDGLAGDESPTPALIVDPVGPGLVPSCRTIIIGSQAGASSYNIDGSNATASVAKLTNPANFGAAGDICCYSYTTVTVPDPITEAAINAANIDIWWSGFEADANYSAAEIIEIQNWINNGGFVIAGCDGTANDPLCALLGITLSGANVASGTSSVVADLGTCFPNVAAPIANGGGAVTTFSGTAGLEIITTQDQLSGPSVVYGNGIVALTDINMITNDGCCLTAGSALTNTNDFFLADIVCELASLADVGANCFDPLDSDGDTIADIDDLDDDNDGILDAVEECQSISFTGTWSTVSASSVSASLGANTVTISQVVSSGGNTSWSFTPNNTFNAIDLWSTAVVEGADALDFVFFWDNTPEVESPASNDSGQRTVTIAFTIPVDNPIIHVDRLGGSAEFFSLGGDFVSNSTEWTLTTSGITMNKLSGNAQFRVVGNRFFRVPNINLGQPNPGGEPTLDTSGTAAGSIQFVGTNISSLVFDVSGIGPDGLPSGDGIRFIVEDCIEIDTDNDGISNHLDLDSDGDGCPDVIEGGLNFVQADLTDATATLLNVPNNNNNDGSVTGYLGTTTDSVISNLGVTSDTDPVSPTFGVPLSTSLNTPNTQGVGESANVGNRNACCTTTPPGMVPN